MAYAPCKHASIKCHTSTIKPPKPVNRHITFVSRHHYMNFDYGMVTLDDNYMSYTTFIW